MSADIISVLDKQVVVCEGSMGTMLASHSVSVRNDAEAAITHPETVLHIHRRFAEAGADLLLSHTRGANASVLRAAGLMAEASAIWSEAMRLCRNAAGRDGFVGLTLGPCGQQVGPGGDVSPQEARVDFRQQLETMLGQGADLVVADGFDSMIELQAATEAIRQLDTSIPVAVGLRFCPLTGRTRDGIDAAGCARRLSQMDVQVAGVSGGEPGAQETALRALAQCTVAHRLAYPDLGVAQGATLPTQEAEHVGECAARLICDGARIVGFGGGCTPEHVRQVVRAARAMA